MQIIPRVLQLFQRLFPRQEKYMAITQQQLLQILPSTG